MKINSNYKQAFGKQALLSCSIREKKNENMLHRATLYELDVNNPQDRKDVHYSKHTSVISRDFNQAQYEKTPRNQFYVVQDNNTGEIISCVETSKHYGLDNKPYNNYYTLIEEAKENKKFNNGMAPILSYLSQQAEKSLHQYLIAACDDDNMQELEKSGFTQAKTGEYYLPKEKFGEYSKNLEHQYNIEYIT